MGESVKLPTVDGVRSPRGIGNGLAVHSEDVGLDELMVQLPL
jgi:hypothetical protein